MWSQTSNVTHNTKIALKSLQKSGGIKEWFNIRKEFEDQLGVGTLEYIRGEWTYPRLDGPRNIAVADATIAKDCSGLDSPRH